MLYSKGQYKHCAMRCKQILDGIKDPVSFERGLKDELQKKLNLFTNEIFSIEFTLSIRSICLSSLLAR